MTSLTLAKHQELDVIGILAVLIQVGAPVDETAVNNAIKYLGSENILPKAIHSMQRLKRYGITEITFNRNGTNKFLLFTSKSQMKFWVEWELRNGTA